MSECCARPCPSNIRGGDETNRPLVRTPHPPCVPSTLPHGNMDAVAARATPTGPGRGRGGPGAGHHLPRPKPKLIRPWHHLLSVPGTPAPRRRAERDGAAGRHRRSRQHRRRARPDAGSRRGHRLTTSGCPWARDQRRCICTRRARWVNGRVNKLTGQHENWACFVLIFRWYICQYIQLQRREWRALVILVSCNKRSSAASWKPGTCRP